jgi:hypothetical protein
LDLHVLEAEMLKERDELSTVFRNALAVNSTGLKPSFSWALQSNALHAGIRDIAALQLACNDIGNRFPISSLTSFEIPPRDVYVMRRGFHSLSLELFLLGSGAPIFLLSLTL